MGISKYERNYGIDLLRILSMLMVVIIHVSNLGGILGNTTLGSLEDFVTWFIFIGSVCAVNSFALVSGYLMAGKTFRYRKIVPMWLTIFFYTALFLIVAILFAPNLVSKEYFYNFTPIISVTYWYFTAYVCLCFFIPFLNFLIENLPKKSFYLLLATGFMLFSVIQMFSINEKDSFGLNFGYSAWWLMYLYLLGGGIKKYNMFSKLTPLKSLLGFFAMITLAWCVKYIVIKISLSGIPIISGLATTYTDGRFFLYTSPTMVLAAVFLMMFCLKLKIPKFFNKPLGFISQLCFQVYIIHANPIVSKLIIYKKYGEIASYNVFGIVLGIFGISILIFMGCILIDTVRFYLFRLFKVDKTVNKIADKVILKLKEKTKVG